MATSPGNIGDTARVVEAAGAYDLPGTPAAPSSVGADASWADEAYAGIQELPVTEPDSTAASIESDLAAAERAAGTLPKLAQADRILMGGIGGYLAREAGDYVIGKLFTPADTPTGRVWNLNGYTLVDPGETVEGRCWTSPCVQADPDQYLSYAAPANASARIYRSTSNQNVFYYCPGAQGTYGSPSGMVGGIPDGASVVNLQLEPSIGAGTCGQNDSQSFVVVDPIDPGEFAPAGNPAGPGGAQVGSIASSPCSPNWTCPTATSLESKIADALDSGKYPALSQYLDHQAEPSNYPDPTKPETDDEDKHRCDVSNPTYNNEGGNGSPDPYEVKPGPLPATGRPSGALDAPDPNLRWGAADWEGGYRDNWSGWGFRHIRAKHGWDEQDQLDTMSTLAGPAARLQQGPTSMVYLGPEYTSRGAICVRRVVVEYAAGMEPRGVITSYGEYQGEAP